MKKIVLAMLLVAAITAVAQTSTPPAQAPPAQTPTGQTPPAQTPATPAPAAQTPPAQAAPAQGAAAKTPQDLTDAAQYGEKGLQVLPTWPKPEGMADADFQKFKTQTGVIFHGAVGMAAFQNKDYAKAEENLRAAVNSDPTDVNNIYP